ncbi:MAG: hypothetical protein J5I93_00920 [Pirellulaceae bacterium]|nr:hypothetical protein [Pirellulaceae bacterium]
MMHLPRLALGRIQPDVDQRPVLWALLSVLERLGLQVQVFGSQARFDAPTGDSLPGGILQRHLDSWLMTRESCREIFLCGNHDCDLAMVLGTWDGPAEEPGALWESPASGGDACPAATARDGEGRLETLCQWLELPRIAILDAQRLRAHGIPARPRQVEAVLLDRTAPGQAGVALQVDLETVWGVPVLGRLPLLPGLRPGLDRLSLGTGPGDAMCCALADALSESLDVERLLRLAESRGFPAPRLAGRETAARPRRCNIAVAYDEAFHCYFPDALDLLERLGARLHDFSPLRSERLPPATDVVYFGCGNLIEHARELAGNCCLKQDLQRHAARGGRIYAECSGVAYLCEQLVLPNSRTCPMAAVLPAIARRNPQAGPSRPATVRLSHACWLGPAGTELRGYQAGTWQFEPTGPLQYDQASAVLGCQRVVGSLLHLNFAALPEILERFFRPLPSPLAAGR